MKDPVVLDAERQLWVVPIRHHSPACAAQLERLINAVEPAAILVEGPCDFDPLIALLCDPGTRAPVAVVSLREAGERQATRRVASYFPFCAYSPELIALQAAGARGIPARFIDLPSTAREMDLDDRDDGAPQDGRSLLGSERLFGVGDYVTALARELGCRDGNEVWDQLFETRIADRDIAWLGSYGKGNDLLPLLGLPQNLFNVTAEQRHEAAVEHRDSRDETFSDVGTRDDHLI